MSVRAGSTTAAKYGQIVLYNGLGRVVLEGGRSMAAGVSHRAFRRSGGVIILPVYFGEVVKGTAGGEQVRKHGSGTSKIKHRIAHQKSGRAMYDLGCDL